MADWLIVEMFGGQEEPTIIGKGVTPKSFVPLRAILGRGPNLLELQGVLARVAREGIAIDTLSGNRSRRIIAQPLIAYTGNVHGARTWVGRPDEEPPTPSPAGAWHFNLTTDTIGGSDDLLDLYGVAPEQRQHQRHTAEAFTRLITNSDVNAAMALMVRSEPGAEHQAVWTVRRDDQQLRAAHFSLRAVQEQHSDHQVHTVLRGITHDIGPAEEVRAAPPPVLLEQKLLESTAETGEHRALVNLRTFNILNWVDAPMPGLAWEHSTASGRSWIHPDDLSIAAAISRGLATSKQEAQLRFRGSTGWIEVQVLARLVALDQHTTAALFTFRDPNAS